MTNLILSISLAWSVYFVCPPCPVEWADCPAVCVRVAEHMGMVYIPFVAAP